MRMSISMFCLITRSRQWLKSCPGSPPPRGSSPRWVVVTPSWKAAYSSSASSSSSRRWNSAGFIYAPRLLTRACIHILAKAEWDAPPPPSCYVLVLRPLQPTLVDDLGLYLLPALLPCPLILCIIPL